MRIEKPKEKVLESFKVTESFRIMTTDGNYILDEGDTLQVVEANGLELSEDVQIPSDNTKEAVILESGDFVKIIEANTLDQVMSKVGKGEDLSKEDKEMLSVAIDTVKGDGSKEIKDIMKKVQAGKELSSDEQKKLSAAIDASKNEEVDDDEDEEEVDEKCKKNKKESISRIRRRKLKEDHISGRLLSDITASLIEAIVERGGDYAAEELVELFENLQDEYKDMMDDFDQLKVFFRRLYKIIGTFTYI